MSLKHMEEILGLQGYSIDAIDHAEDTAHITFTKSTASYCCPTCQQMTCMGYDSTWRTVEDRPLVDKRLFLSLPVYRLHCPTCHTVQTEALPCLQPYQR